MCGACCCNWTNDSKCCSCNWWIYAPRLTLRNAFFITNWNARKKERNFRWICHIYIPINIHIHISRRISSSATEVGAKGRRKGCRRETNCPTFLSAINRVNQMPCQHHLRSSKRAYEMLYNSITRRVVTQRIPCKWQVHADRVYFAILCLGNNNHVFIAVKYCNCQT